MTQTTKISNRRDQVAELFDIPATVSLDDFHSFLETVERWLSDKSKDEIETVVKHLVGKVIATPLTSVYDADCVIALQGLFFAIPGLEIFDGEESLDTLATWIDHCFPDGTKKAAMGSLLSLDELYQSALAVHSEGNEDGLKFKNWFLIAFLVSIIADAYRYHFEVVEAK